MHLSVNDRVYVRHSSMGVIDLVGRVLDIRHHSYGDYATMEVESPPEHAGKHVNVYSGRVRKP